MNDHEHAAVLPELTKRYHDYVDPLLRIPSISTDEAHRGNVHDAAVYLAQYFARNEFNVNVFPGYGNPIVVAEYIHNPDLPTVLIYGHYDVQPANVADGWESDPWEPTFRDGRFFVRGSADNKGQTGQSVAAALELMHRQALGYNIRFVLEGDEETGQGDMEKFLRDHKEKLRCDFVMVSDGELTGVEPHVNPSAEVSFRGGFNVELTVRTAKTKLHSGTHGGGAPEAAGILTRLLAELVDDNNKITLKGWYDDMPPISDAVRAEQAKIPFDVQEYAQMTGVEPSLIEHLANGEFYVRTGLMPSISYTAVDSGYHGAGFENSIAHTASTKINFRTAPGQDPERLLELFKAFVAKKLGAVPYELHVEAPTAGVRLSTDNPYMERAKAILARVYGAEVIERYVGGSIPFATFVDEIFAGTPQLYIPTANEDCGMHAPNENLTEEAIAKGLLFYFEFLRAESQPSDESSAT